MTSELIGQTFGGYTVLSVSEKKPRTAFVCQCKCGLICEVEKVNLKRNKCGCKDCVTGYVEAGTVFGRLTVLGFYGTKNSQKLYTCRCECGVEKIISGVNLRKGSSKSCGCLQKDVASILKKTHGQSRSCSGKKTPVYHSWQGMKRRCDNERCEEHKYYGGIGIKYDPEWALFENFYADMGERPQGTSLDRINVYGNYCKENCRWSNRTVQSLNSKKRKNSVSRYKGVSFSKGRGLWVAKTRKSGKTTYLGGFAKEEDAAALYDATLIEMYGSTDGTNKSLGLL